MPRRILKESVIVVGGTLFFLVLCATAGISLSTRNAAPIVAAEEQEYVSEGESTELLSVCIRQYPHTGEE